MINIDQLKKTHLLNNEELHSFFTLFKTSIDQDWRELESAINEQNISTVHKTAHKLKFGFKYVGLKNISDNLEQIQNLAESGSNFRQINSRYQYCKPLIQELLIEINNLQKVSA